MHICTFGDPIFQKQKIDLLGINNDGLFFSELGQKIEHLSSSRKFNGQVWFIEDNPDELDAVRREYSQEQVLTIG